MGLISNRNSLSNNDLANWDTSFLAPSLDELPLVIDAFFATQKMVDFYYNMICFHKRVRLNMLWGPKFRGRPWNGPTSCQPKWNWCTAERHLVILVFLMMGEFPNFQTYLGSIRPTNSGKWRLGCGDEAASWVERCQNDCRTIWTKVPSTIFPA